MTTRTERITAALAAHGVAGLVLMPATNLAYLSGLAFHPGKRLTLFLLPAAGGTPALIVPALDHARAMSLADRPLQYFPWQDADGPAAAVSAALAAVFPPETRSMPLAVEHTVMRVGELRALEAAWPGLQTVNADPIMAKLRMVKDADELAAMQHAAQMIDRALELFVPQLRVGRSERELARLLGEAISAVGAEGEAFSTMIAGGPNGANPHHECSDRPLQAGDLVIVDCGARWQGYLSDITRTFAIGEPGEEARRVYALVEAANAAGKAVCRPGISGAQVDAAARDVIAAAGYGAAFVHRTGHGLGRDIHELPDMVAGNHVALQVGTTFTVEPGIYLPGRFGVRIEDDMVITPDGALSLTSYPRGLQVLPVD